MVGRSPKPPLPQNQTPNHRHSVNQDPSSGDESVDAGNSNASSSDPSSPESERFAIDNTPLGLTAGRGIFGGILMGLANLVPGISGGTMLLAAGIYPAFVESLANVTRFKFSTRAIVVLGSVGMAAVLAILLFAGTLKELVVEHRWVMYSLFIGLTLGGVPLVWRLTESGKRATASLIIPALLAFAAMMGLPFMEAGNEVNNQSSGFVMLFFAGLAGASAMILPGLSGGYLLLLMKQYVPILSAVDTFKEALKARDVSAAMEPALQVLLPVGIGVIVGIVVVGNLLKWMFAKYRTQTLGILLGLLIGSVGGLYPFKEYVAPQVGDIIKAERVTTENIELIEKEDWPTRSFRPTFATAAMSLGLIGVGFAITLGVGQIGKDND